MKATATTKRPVASYGDAIFSFFTGSTQAPTTVQDCSLSQLHAFLRRESYIKVIRRTASKRSEECTVEENLALRKHVHPARGFILATGRFNTNSSSSLISRSGLLLLRFDCSCVFDYKKTRKGKYWSETRSINWERTADKRQSLENDILNEPSLGPSVKLMFKSHCTQFLIVIIAVDITVTHSRSWNAIHAYLAMKCRGLFEKLRKWSPSLAAPCIISFDAHVYLKDKYDEEPAPFPLEAALQYVEERRERRYIELNVKKNGHW
jgi:hypothetical protein